MAFIEDSSRPKEPSTAKSSEILVMELVPEANGGATEPQNALSKRFSERQAVGLSEAAQKRKEGRVRNVLLCVGGGRKLKGDGPESIIRTTRVHSFVPFLLAESITAPSR